MAVPADTAALPAAASCPAAAGDDGAAVGRSGPAVGRSGPAVRWAWPAAVALLALAALGLRAWGLRHGLPYVYNVDEQSHFVPRAIGFFGHSYNPHYFVNPPAFTYVLHAVFAAWFGGGDAVARAASADPGAVYTVARAVSAALGAAAVALLAVAAARLLGSRAAGLLAGALLAVAFLPVHYGHLALNDGPALAAVALGLLGSAGVLQRGRRRDYLLAGAAVGLAAATKYTAGIVLVPVLGAALMAARTDRGAAARGAGVALAAALAAFVAANPYAVLDADAFLHGLAKQAGAAGSTTKLGMAETSGHAYYLATLGWGLGWLPAAAAVGGAIGTVWRDRRLAGVLVPAPVLFIAWMGMQDRFFGRWLMPILPILCVLAAWTVLAVVRAVRGRHPGLAPGVAAVLAGALLAQGVVSSLHNDAVLARADTRGLARDWLARHVAPGTPVVVEPIVPDAWAAPWQAAGPRPGGAAALAAGVADGARAGGAAAAAGLAARLGAAAAAPRRIGGRPLERLPRSPRVVGAEGYVRTLQPALLDAYRRDGACWVVTGSTQQGRAAAQPARVPGALAYYRALAREATVAARFSPFDPGAAPVPFGFDRSFNAQPLAYRRPGPVVTIYRLRGGRCGPAPDGRAARRGRTPILPGAAAP